LPPGYALYHRTLKRQGGALAEAATERE